MDFANLDRVVTGTFAPSVRTAQERACKKALKDIRKEIQVWQVVKGLG
jgi:hypothetical protein